MLKLTRNGAVLVDGVADYYVKDRDYLLLSTNKEAREELLNDLNVSSIIVDRLGEELEPDKKFRKNPISAETPVLEITKEMGYYDKL